MPLDSHDHVLLSSKALCFQGGSDGVITDDSPQVVDVAASSNQGQARLANKTSDKLQATAALESQAPRTGSLMKSHLQRLRPGGAVERF